MAQMKVRQEKAVNRVLSQVGSMEREWRRSVRVEVSFYMIKKGTVIHSLNTTLFAVAVP
jgi:hypothetical protein